jgi:hypothetical protein
LLTFTSVCFCSKLLQLGVAINFGNYFTHLKNFHPEELSYTDVCVIESKGSKKAAVATKSSKTDKGAEATQMSLQSTYTAKSNKAEISKKNSLTTALVRTICHTPCAMYTVMNPATRQFVANILRVSVDEVKLPSYSAVTRAVHATVKEESLEYMSRFLEEIGAICIPVM